MIAFPVTSASDTIHHNTCDILASEISAPLGIPNCANVFCSPIEDKTQQTHKRNSESMYAYLLIFGHSMTIVALQEQIPPPPVNHHELCTDTSNEVLV